MTTTAPTAAPEATVAEMKLQVLTNTVIRLRDLKALAATNPKGVVFAWANYSLGAKVVDGKATVVGVEHATVYWSSTNLTFTNGGGERAVRVARKVAIERAIVNTEAVLFSMVDAFAKTEA